jgi:hypothetical protein
MHRITGDVRTISPIEEKRMMSILVIPPSFFDEGFLPKKIFLKTDFKLTVQFQY